MAKGKQKHETYWQKEKRLKARKSVYKETYKKGVFFDNKHTLIDWLNQNDIIVRVNAAGKLDDESEFIQITIEGFKP